MDAATREFVHTRSRHRCEYCLLLQSSAPFLTFHVEHIIASQHLQDDGIDNLALACPDCNRHKGPNLSSVDPLTLQIVTLFHPRRERWTDHFSVVNANIAGLTPIGRATAKLLRFNDPERLAIREALQQMDEWPPHRH
ncbi:HNH endonuclease [bacterium]|nr:HNH endonuclease [bacterium]